MSGFFRTLISLFTDEMDESQLPTTIPKQQPMQQQHDDDEDDEYYDEEVEYDDEDDDFRVQHDDADDAFDTLVDEIMPYYNEPRATLRHVFTQFRREVPVANLDALQYLDATTEIREAKHGVFPRLVYSELLGEAFRPICSVKAIANAEDTFLVNKRLDFLYGRLIETALCPSVDAMRQEARRLFMKRARLLETCRAEHLDDERCCPMEWVIYTKMNSQFYRFCSEQLVKRNPYINHQTSTTDFIKLERLSFYLVLFLCGELMEGTPSTDFTSIPLERSPSHGHLPRHQYGEINQWFKVPLWFLDVWLASQYSV